MRIIGVGIIVYTKLPILNYILALNLKDLHVKNEEKLLQLDNYKRKIESDKTRIFSLSKDNDSLRIELEKSNKNSGVIANKDAFTNTDGKHKFNIQVHKNQNFGRY